MFIVLCIELFPFHDAYCALRPKSDGVRPLGSEPCQRCFLEEMFWKLGAARIATDHLRGRELLAFARAAHAIQRLVSRGFPSLLHLEVEALFRTYDVATVTRHHGIGLLPLELLMHTPKAYKICALAYR